MSVAALPMYDMPGLHQANDELWTAIATRLNTDGVNAPIHLTRNRELDEIWTAPDLLLAQTCGYPLVTSLKNKVAIVATPRYSAAGCEGAFYRSAVIVRLADSASRLSDLRGRRCAINDRASNSGMNLLRYEIAPLAHGARFFEKIAVTGSHAASLSAVAEGEADVAAIDCVSWAHFERLTPATARAVRVLCWTARSPGLPLVTSVDTDPGAIDALHRALGDVAQDPSLRPIRLRLFLDGFDRLSITHYRDISWMEREAASHGYPSLC